MTKTRPISPLLAALVGMGTALFLSLFATQVLASDVKRGVLRASEHRCKSWEPVVTQIANLTLFPGQMTQYRKVAVDPLAAEAPLIHRYLVAEIERSRTEPYAIVDAVLDDSWLGDCARAISSDQLAAAD